MQIKEKGHKALLELEVNFLKHMKELQIRHLEDNVHSVEVKHREAMGQMVVTAVTEYHQNLHASLKKLIDLRGEYHMAQVRKATVSERRIGMCGFVLYWLIFVS